MRRELPSVRLLVVHGTLARACPMLYGQHGTAGERGSPR